MRAPSYTPPTLPDKLVADGVTSQLVVGPPLLEKIGGAENLRVLEEEALALAVDGTLVPLVRRFPLADAAGAHEALENRGTTGKVVLSPPAQD